MTEYCHYYQVVPSTPQKRHSERKRPLVSRFRCGGFRGVRGRKTAEAAPPVAPALRATNRKRCGRSSSGGLYLLRSEALPLRSPPTPRKRRPLVRGLRPKAQPLLAGALFGSSGRFICGFARAVARFAPRAPARRSPPGAAPRGVTLWSVPRSGGRLRS